MNDERRRGDEDLETGEPIPEIAALREEPPPRFLDRIRGSINRRTLAADVVRFSMSAFTGVLLDYLKMIIQVLGGSSGKGGERS